MTLSARDKSARACMFREKNVDVNTAIDQLRYSDIVAQQIKNIESKSTGRFSTTCKGGKTKDKKRDDISCLQIYTV